jgi:hypothetical protein
MRDLRRELVLDDATFKFCIPDLLISSPMRRNVTSQQDEIAAASQTPTKAVFFANNRHPFGLAFIHDCSRRCGVIHHGLAFYPATRPHTKPAPIGWHMKPTRLLTILYH